MKMGVSVVMVVGILALGVVGCSKAEEPKTAAPRPAAAQPAHPTADVVAKEKDQLVSSTSTMLDALQRQLSDLQVAAEAKGAQAKADYGKLKPELDSAMVAAKASLEEAKQAGADTWASARDKLNKAVSDLQGAYMQARMKFQPVTGAPTN